MWGLHMLNQGHKFLPTKKAIKPRLSILSRMDQRHSTIPSNILRLREQLPHQLILTRNLKTNATITQLASPTLSTVHLVLIDCLDSFIHIDKLDKSFGRLATLAFHDYVDGLVDLIDDARVAAEEGDELGTSEVPSDLYQQLAVFLKDVGERFLH
jgi:hypothetical protein